MKSLALTAALFLALAMTIETARAQQSYDERLYTSMAGTSESVPAGTRITIQNWQKYKGFMSAGLRAIMSQQYFWKVPAEAALEVGPAIKIGLPRKYREDT